MIKHGGFPTGWPTVFPIAATDYVLVQREKIDAFPALPINQWLYITTGRFTLRVLIHYPFKNTTQCRDMLKAR